MFKKSFFSNDFFVFGGLGPNKIFIGILSTLYSSSFLIITEYNENNLTQLLINTRKEGTNEVNTT